MKKLFKPSVNLKVRMCISHIIHEDYTALTIVILLLGLVLFLSMCSVDAVSTTSADLKSAEPSTSNYREVVSTITTTSTSAVTTSTTMISTTDVITSSAITSAESVSTTQVISESTDCAEAYTETVEESITYDTLETASMLTDSEIYLLAALVAQEGGCESYECKLAIASTVINRMSLSNSSLEDVLYASGQFTTASTLASTMPSDECIAAATDVATLGSTLPVYVIFFRAGYYHSWGDQQPYTYIDNTYFSYSQATKEGLS